MFFAVAFLALYFLLQLHVFNLFGTYLSLLQKLSLGCFFATIVLALSRFAQMLVTRHSHSVATRYNLIRLIRLLTILLIAIVIISFLFKNWYAAAVSLGLFSLVLGFALQTPISSFIGWVYLLLRAPYRVGDRIQVGTFTGDVVEIHYLDTTLWEFGGDYLTNDLPSGRLIRFPNSLIFQSQVYNYSWEKFPFIWNEIPFHVAYESDLDFVETTIREITKRELGEEVEETIKRFKKLLAQTPIDELEVKEYPYINFRINTNTWVEVMVTYLVHPKHAGVIRNRLIKNITSALLKEPDRVMFPKSNAR